MPVFTPGSTNSGFWLRYLRDISARVRFSGGTTELMMMPLIAFGLQLREREKVARQNAVFVDGLVARGRQSPVRDEFLAAKHAEHRVRVAHIQGQKHQSASATSPERTSSVDCLSSRATRSTPLGSSPAVVPVKLSVEVVMRTRFPRK